MIRNFLFVLKRFRTSAVLNIIGLSVAFAVFSVTMIQCYYDFSYNRSFKNAKDIYQFSCFWEIFEKQSAHISIPLAHAITDRFPEVKACCILDRGGNKLFNPQADQGTSFLFHLINTNEAFLDVFTPRILAGDAKEVFAEKNKAMLTEDVAKRLFGKNDPIGQTIWQDTVSYVVTAVCESFPANSSLTNGVYTTVLGSVGYDKMGMYNYEGYFLLDRKDVLPLQEKLEQMKFEGAIDLVRVEFIPVAEKYFRRDVNIYGEKQGNLATTLSLMAIGIITLLMSFINFMNFSVAMIPARIREMNIKKIMGVNPRLLQALTVSEAPCFALLAFLTSLFLIVLFQGTRLDEFFPADLFLSKNVGILAVIALTGMFLSVLFGIYPAWKITSFQPAMALSSSFAQSKQSVALRNILIVLQFFAAIVLTGMAIFIKVQYDYMTNYSWGFQKENIVYLSVASKNFITIYEDEIRQNPTVLDCTASNAIPGYINQNWGMKMEVDEKEIALAVWVVRNDFLRFFDIEVVEGRDFIPDDDGKSRFICNRTFLKKYELNDIIGKKVDRYEIVGIIKDIHFESLHSEIRPMGFITQRSYYNGGRHWLFVRIAGENTLQTIDYLKETWSKHTDDPFDIHFLDDQLDSLYQSESTLARLISIFGIIAVIIAIMGIYGLIVFNAKYKAREIAIRKVNGSTIREIILMLNRDVLLQLSIAFGAAVPVTVYIVDKWLENFAYKIAVYWWVFLLSGGVVLLITLLTVSAQSYKAARMNPTQTLNIS
ncbi:MAG: hypothetical protein LBG28_07300 [Tannerella sp.]|jgi:putative ABC transport system permease protein|nr:hypothetical protein [Tannerella sp.]